LRKPGCFLFWMLTLSLLIFNSFILNYFRYSLKIEVSSEIESALPSEVLLLREFSRFARMSALSFPGMPTWLGT
jgi:hypothetical protein